MPFHFAAGWRGVLLQRVLFAGKVLIKSVGNYFYKSNYNNFVRTL
jgi:hypothetical protein